MRVPLIEVRLAGLAISVRVISDRLNGRSGRTKLLALARLLGLLSASRLGIGPNESRLIPEVERRGTCLVTGVSSLPSPPIDEALAVLPPVRFLLRIVTLGGI